MTSPHLRRPADRFRQGPQAGVRPIDLWRLNMYPVPHLSGKPRISFLDRRNDVDCAKERRTENRFSPTTAVDTRWWANAGLVRLSPSKPKSLSADLLRLQGLPRPPPSRRSALFFPRIGSHDYTLHRFDGMPMPRRILARNVAAECGSCVSMIRSRAGPCLHRHSPLGTCPGSPAR